MMQNLMCRLTIHGAACLVILLLAAEHTAFGSENDCRNQNLLGQAVYAVRPSVNLYRGPAESGRTERVFFGVTFVLQQISNEWIRVPDGWLRFADVVARRDALRYFDATTADRSTAFLRASRAMCFSLRGESEKAGAEAEAARRLDANSPYVQYALGVLCAARDDHLGAVRFFSMVIDSQPSIVDAYRRRGWAHLATGALDMAEQDFLCAAQQFPGGAQTASLRAFLRVAREPECLKDGEKGVAELARLYSEVPLPEIAGAYAAGLLIRCSARLERRQFDAALADADEAVRVRPIKQAFVKRSQCYESLNRHSDEARDCASAIALDPNDGSLQLRLALALQAMGDARGARAALTKGIQLGRDEPDVYYLRGLLSEREDRAAAISDYDLAIKRDPKFSAAYHRRALAYHDSAQYEKAIADFDEVIKNDPESAEARLDRARSLVALRRFVEATRDCDKVVALNVLRPQDNSWRIEALRMRYGLQIILQKYEEAMKDLNELILMCPSDAKLYRDRAGVWSALHDHEKALDDLTESLRLVPTAEAYHQRAGILSILGREIPASVDREQARRLENEQSAASARKKRVMPRPD